MIGLLLQNWDNYAIFQSTKYLQKYSESLPSFLHGSDLIDKLHIT